jgi:hypothetical protein
VVAGEDGEQILKVRTILAQTTDASQEEKLLLLHKLDSLSRELPSKSIVSLIGLAIDCFRTTTDEGRLIGSEFHACRTWLSHLVVRAAQSDAPPAAEETFAALIEGTGIRVTVEILDEASDRPQFAEPWLSELIALAVQEATITIEKHLEEKTEGDPPAVQSLLRFIDARGGGLEDIRSRIEAGPESGRWLMSLVVGAEQPGHLRLGAGSHMSLCLVPRRTSATFASASREPPASGSVPSLETS